MDQAHPRGHDLRLSPLHVPYKVPLEGVPEPLLLLDEVLGPVLPDEVHAHSRERAYLLRRVVLASDEDSDLPGPPPGSLERPGYVLPHPGEPLPHTGLGHRRRQRGALTTAARLRPVTGFCLRWEKKRSGRHPVHRPRSTTSTPSRSRSTRIAPGSDRCRPDTTPSPNSRAKASASSSETS